MEKQMVLSPEELYYLGTVLQAKYIDYAYVAAMNDIGQNYPLWENETKASLVRSGVLMEDFSGNIQIDAGALGLLKPIFFGEVETSVDVCKLGAEESKVIICKYHFFDGTITMVTGENGKLIIKGVDQLDIKNLVSGLVAEDYSCVEPSVVSEIQKEKVSRFIVAKSITVGQISSVTTYIEVDGILYCEKEAGQIKSMTRDMFISDVYGIVKGA